jgi:hypothetical protein
MHRTLSPTTRRSFVQGGLLTALALVTARGQQAIPDVAASKNDGRKPKSIAKRAETYRRSCEASGGTATVSKKRGGTTVACTGSEGGSWSCTVHSKGSRCHATRTVPDLPSHPFEQADSPFASPGDGTTHPLEPAG